MKRSPLRLLILVALLAGAPLGAADPVDLLLVAGDDALLQPMLAKLTGAEVTTHGAWTCWIGQLGGKRVALTRAEGDPLNAVAATTLAIREHPPKRAIVFTCARAHDPALHAGDCVVSESFAAFDGFFSPRRELDEGSRPANWDTLPHLLMTPGEKEVAAPGFPADPATKAVALTLTPTRGRVIAGVLGSANQINRESDRIAWIRAHWHTSTEDQVSAHVAGCAKLFGVPIVGIAIVEGTADETAGFALRLVEALK